MRSRVAKEARAVRRNKLFFVYGTVAASVVFLLALSYILVRIYAPRINQIVVLEPAWLVGNERLKSILDEMPSRFLLPAQISPIFNESQYASRVKEAFPAMDTLTVSVDGEVLTLSATTYTPVFLVCIETCMQGDVHGHMFIDPQFTATSTLYSVTVPAGLWSKVRATQIMSHITALEAASLQPSLVLINPEEYLYEIRYTSDTSWRVRVPATATSDYVTQALSSALSNVAISQLLKDKKLDTLDMRLQQRLFYTSI